jgi:hypothetical protein
MRCVISRTFGKLCAVLRILSEVVRLFHGVLLCEGHRGQGTTGQLPEIFVGRIHESHYLIERQVADARGFDILERLDAAPGTIARDVPIAPRSVERRFQDREDSVRCRLAPALLS